MVTDSENPNSFWHELDVKLMPRIYVTYALYVQGFLYSPEPQLGGFFMRLRHRTGFSNRQ